MEGTFRVIYSEVQQYVNGQWEIVALLNSWEDQVIFYENGFMIYNDSIRGHSYVRINPEQEYLFDINFVDYIISSELDFENNIYFIRYSSLNRQKNWEYS